MNKMPQMTQIWNIHLNKGTFLSLNMAAFKLKYNSLYSLVNERPYYHEAFDH